MAEINERVSQLIRGLGHNPSSFAKSLGKAQSSVAVIVEGRSKPGFDFLELVCTTYPEVSRDWLLVGEGTMFKSSQKSAEPDDYLKSYLKKLEDKFIVLLEAKDKQMEAKDRQMEGMQRTIDALLVGKSNSVSRRPNKTSVAHLPNTNLFKQVPVFE